MTPWRILRTISATIGLKSNAPARSPSRRKIRSRGSETSRRKSSTTLNTRLYGTRTPRANTNESTIQATMHSW
jgi:hypothetical protein